jgi:hypothetical protein
VRMGIGGVPNVLFRVVPFRHHRARNGAGYQKASPR